MSFQFRAEQWLPVPLEKVFRFFADPGNLPRLMPPWMRVELLRINIVPPPRTEPVKATVSDPPIFAGAGSELVASYRVFPFLPFRSTSVALITEFAINDYFADVQKEGPFRMWHHHHQFVSQRREGQSGTLVQDIVEYEIGFGWLGALAQKLFVGPQMRRTFAHRQKILAKFVT